MITVQDLIAVNSLKISDDALASAVKQALNLATSVVDRGDLHARDWLERYNNILIGEVAEIAVIAFLHSNGKQAVSAVDKSSGRPDDGHDLWVTSKKTGERLECTVKSSISQRKNFNDIVTGMTMPIKKTELRDLNVMVYFRYSMDHPRASVPSLREARIIGWKHKSDFESDTFSERNGEEREMSSAKLSTHRAMATLLPGLE